MTMTTLSLTNRLLRGIFSKPTLRLLVLGVEGSGKTSIISRLARPAEPFIENYTASQHCVVEIAHTAQCTLSLCEVAGRTALSQLQAPALLENMHGVVFVVDCADRERLPAAAALLDTALRCDALQGLPVLLLLNKQDYALCESSESVLDALQVRAGERALCVQPCSALTDEGLCDGLQWMQRTLSPRNNTVFSAYFSRSTVTTVAASERERLSETALPRARALRAMHDDESAESDAETLRLALQHCQQQSNNNGATVEEDRESALFVSPQDTHVSRLRLVWICLRRFGRRAALPLLFRLLRSEPWSRGAPCDTLTYFWVHSVHHALAVEEALGGRVDATLTLRALLSRHTHLLDEHALPREYFSERVLREAAAPEHCEEISLPDVKPLPSLVNVPPQRLRVTAPSSSSAAQPVPQIALSQPVHVPEEPHVALSDREFLSHATQGTLGTLSHTARLRLLYVTLVVFGRERGGVDLVLAALESAEQETFELTRSYFWVQMLTYHMVRVHSTLEESHRDRNALFGVLTNNVDGYASSADNILDKAMSFGEFSQDLNVQEIFDPLLIDRYYSRESQLAMHGNEVILPTLKPMPNLIMKEFIFSS